jgi:hypothetical protein
MHQATVEYEAFSVCAETSQIILTLPEGSQLFIKTDTRAGLKRLGWFEDTSVCIDVN